MTASAAEQRVGVGAERHAGRQRRSLTTFALSQTDIPKYLLVFVAYLLGGKLGLAVPFTSGNVSPVWPAAGIAIAAVLVFGYRVWPSIAVAAFLVNVFTPIPPLSAVGIACGNTAGALAGAWLTRRIPGFQPSLTRLTDVLGIMLVAAPAAAAISAAVGTAVLSAAGVHAWGTLGNSWRVWSMGDAMGVLIVTPVLLTVTRKRAGIGELTELGALGATVAIVSLVLFHPIAGVQHGIVIAAALTPFVLWGAIRLEMPGATTVVCVISSVAVWETGRGIGPFTDDTALHNAALLQAFLGIIAISGLTLAAAIAERSRLIRAEARREGAAENQRKYQQIVETANEGIWMLDEGFVTIFANPRLAELLGYTVPEMFGKPLSDFCFAEDVPQAATDLVRPSRPATEVLQRRYRRKDGSELLALVARTAIFDEQGTFAGLLQMLSDVTDQKRAEQESQRTREMVLLLSKAVEQTADGVILTDRNGLIEYVNPAFEATTGYTRDEAIGNTPRLLKSGQHDDAFYRGMWQVLLRGEPFRGTLVNRRKNGEHYWAEQTITPLKDPLGRITHFVSVVKDITEARRSQEQQVQLQLARRVQQRFYSSTASVPGFDIAACTHPAEQTGGDYFDVIATAGGGCYIAIGDVSGHGLDAALVMAMTRAYVRSFAMLGLEVGDILARLNEVLLEELEENRFVTLLLARLEPHSRHLECASAGHVPGYLLNRTGETEVEIGCTGVPLGLFPDATFLTHRLQLRPGDLLLLCTDGASETLRADDEEFGWERVVEHVRVHQRDGLQEIVEGIFQAARSFADGEPQADDITCVLMRVGARSPSAHEEERDRE